MHPQFGDQLTDIYQHTLYHVDFGHIPVDDLLPRKERSSVLYRYTLSSNGPTGGGGGGDDGRGCGSRKTFNVATCPLSSIAC